MIPTNFLPLTLLFRFKRVDVASGFESPKSEVRRGFMPNAAMVLNLDENVGLQVPTGSDDAVNRRILAVAEDAVAGFFERPFAEIAARCGVGEATVRERLLAMLRAGTIRRVRQTLLSTDLAEGALVAWKLPEDKLDAAYDWLMQHAPFTGHVVIRRSEEAGAPGADYRLWTTLKVPRGYGSVKEHLALLAPRIGATDAVPLPVVGMFTLSVGHIRRAHLRPGDRTETAPAMQRPQQPVLNAEEWRVLLSLKESLREDEFVPCPWEGRAAALGIDAVLLTPNSCDPLNRRSVRVSMGSVFLVPWMRAASSGVSPPFSTTADPPTATRARARRGSSIGRCPRAWRSARARRWVATVA